MKKNQGEKTLHKSWEEDSAESKLDELIRESNNILDKKTDKIKLDDIYNVNDKNYDPDSSSIAWKYYEMMYGDMIKKDQSVGVAGSPKRILGLFNYTEKNIEQEAWNFLRFNKIVLAGDCVFNFNQKKLKSFLNVLNENQDLLDKLSLCKRMHHSPYNFSLMPVTGGMNKQKQNLSGDRPDVLLYAISEFYKNYKKALETNNMSDIQEKIEELELYNKDVSAISKIIKNNETLQNNVANIRKMLNNLQNELQIIQYQSRGITDLCAYHFLAAIGSFENYVKIFYHLDRDNPVDKSLIETMLDMGQQPIDNPEALNAYMNLAIEYWKRQRSKYPTVVIQNYKTY